MPLTDTEIIHLGRNNSIDFTAYANSSVKDLSGVTEMRLRVGSAVITSTNSTGGNIRWSGRTYNTGEIRIFAGAATGLSTGLFTGALIIFDVSNTAGVTWDDNIPIRVKQNVLTT